MKYNNTLHYKLQEVNADKLKRMRQDKFGWRDERMKANRLVRLYHLAGYEQYAERVEFCSTYLTFYEDISGDNKKLKTANFCKLRLCPICTARGAMVRAKLLSRVMDGAQAEFGGQYIFLTLTVRNVPGAELRDAVGHLLKAWDRLRRQTGVVAAVKGWFRALEITRPGIDSYHPHIHAILAVDDAYFSRSAGLYLSQAEWVRRWQLALGVDYKPSVRVQRTTEGKGGKGAVLEAAKYVTKDSDYISDSLSDQEAAQIVEDYTKALWHRRLTAYGGRLKEMAQRLQADDLDHVDLVQGDDEDTIRGDLAEMVAEYGWHFGAGDYVLARRYVNPLRVKRGGDGGAGR